MKRDLERRLSILEDAARVRDPHPDRGQAMEAVTCMIEAAGGRQVGESWAEALGRLTGLSGYDLKRYLFARAAGHGLPLQRVQLNHRLSPLSALPGTCLL